MSDIRLTCDETPLAWPSTMPITDLKTCESCAVKIIAPYPGSLQILTRRQGNGKGDGVNIEEFNGVSADYRGQRYSYDEAILHVPGLHIFPGRSATYSGEYHIHLRTFTAPVRYLTLVIPIMQDVSGTTNAYFAAMKAQPDPAATRPTLLTLINALGSSSIIQYQGPDIRGRTRDSPTTPECTSINERQFLLVLNPATMRPMDFERIPREGSLSADPRDLPMPGIQPVEKTVSRNRLVNSAVLATPGFLFDKVAETVEGFSTQTELECKPLKVVEGRNMVDISGKSVDIKTLLGLNSDAAATSTQGGISVDSLRLISAVFMSCGLIFGVLFADLLSFYIWRFVFDDSALLRQWEPLKFWIFLIMFGASGYLMDLWLYS